MLANAAALITALAPTSVRAQCSDLFADALASRSQAQRKVTARDLINLRTIGALDGSEAALPTPLALSSDGRRLAFLINRDDPDTNAYCQELFEIQVDRPGKAVSLDHGGERTLQYFGIRGARVSAGFPQIVTPNWSPDNHWVGYLKRTKGVNQIWIAAADGSGAIQITHGTVDVASWAWSENSRAIVFSAETGRAAEAAAIAREGKSGFLYDARIWPDEGGPAPMPAAETSLTTLAVDLGGSEERPATEGERVWLAGATSPGVADGGQLSDTRGWQALTVPESSSPLAARRLSVKDANGSLIRCNQPECSGGLVAAWWRGGQLMFLRQEGWDRERMALYLWLPGRTAPRLILATTDVLLGCVFRDQLVCTAEASTVPRHIVAIDPRTGTRRDLFDPNPEFASIRLGTVQRLHTINNVGLKGWADLVLPPDYRRGTKLPTVIVQYRSRGFLRGGTGDEYPIFLFAAHGFAVLSLEQPLNVAYQHPELRDWDAINAFGFKNWQERRSQLSSLEIALDAAIAKGVIDPTRVGITGLSDGASTVQFALINTRRFAAAAISTCCIEPQTVMTTGIAWADWNRRVPGFPPLTRPKPRYWAPMSLKQNAARFNTPLLMQLADREYIQSFEGFTALRELGKPVEMYVFPDEYHAKVQPRHRLAVFERGLDWFDFWLNGYVDADPERSGRNARWEKMRAALPKRAKLANTAPKPRHRSTA